MGRWVEIHAPDDWCVLGIALDEEACDSLIEAFQSGNKYRFRAALAASEVLRIDRNEKAIVDDLLILEGKAKVILLTGLYKGTSGWIPIEWLDGNQKRPRIPEYFDETRVPRGVQGL